MNLITVDSSMVHGVGYDPNARELEVIFTSGKIYRYEGVPADVYDKLLKAASKGQFMNACIIDVYPDYQVRRR